VNSWVNKLAGFGSEELFVDLIFKGKGRMRVLSEMLMYINGSSRARNYRSDANLVIDFYAIVNENYDINYSRIGFVRCPFAWSFHGTTPYS